MSGVGTEMQTLTMAGTLPLLSNMRGETVYSPLAKEMKPLESDTRILIL